VPIRKQSSLWAETPNDQKKEDHDQPYKDYVKKLPKLICDTCHTLIKKDQEFRKSMDKYWHASPADCPKKP
jgi:hypothetical protein